MALFVVAEGHGEDQALPTLVAKLSIALGVVLPPVPRHRAMRLPLVSKETVVKACELVRRPETKAVLLTRDADDEDDCPRTRAPEMASWVRELGLDFPVAIVLFRREYETMFLAAAERLAGRALRDSYGIERPGLAGTAVYHGDPESTRDAKGWLSANMPPGRTYKPTTDQLALTKMLDFADPKLTALSSFRRLGSALRFLADNLESPGAVYPALREPSP